MVVPFAAMKKEMNSSLPIYVSKTSNGDVEWVVGYVSLLLRRGTNLR